MSEARVPMLDSADARAVAESLGIPAALGELNVFRTLLRTPKAAKPIADLLLSLLFRGALDVRLRELVIMRIGWATGSVYEWTQHWRIARDLGVTDDDLAGVRAWETYAGFGPIERAVLAATDETLGDGAVSAATFATLRDELSDEAALEVVEVIGTWTFVSTLLRSLDVPLEDGVDPWPPDGASPAR